MKFEKNLHTLVWGSESWEISAHNSSPSIIADGCEKGRSLAEVEPKFPVLAKVIDAKTRLSVQVHPNERTALVAGGEPKTEMWCVLESGPIYAGLKPGVGAAEVERAIADGKFEDILVKHDAKKYDTFFIPGGLVHAIGDGVKLYEVQQSSNTTYRLYDWGRVGADGKPRELHVEKSLECIDFSLAVPEPVKDVKCKFFNFTQHDFTEEREVVAESDYLLIYEVDKALSTLLRRGEKAIVAPGRVFLTQVEK
ncbi:MAG: class I mannose-6-phosphate isomerase [Kiritimatiellae bacterium]|jgi:mannose-6-phosphate isomerase|nr:class I mannose-6-phosphate isomerase [Kiritimatiellia bacterium]